MPRFNMFENYQGITNPRKRMRWNLTVQLTKSRQRRRNFSTLSSPPPTRVTEKWKPKKPGNVPPSASAHESGLQSRFRRVLLFANSQGVQRDIGC
jgi:hypothetical protein